MIESSDHKLYTGITNNLSKRWKAHSEGKTGAKFFRGRSPARLLYVETNHDRSSASKREAAIKQLKRAEKLVLIAEQKDQDWHQVYSL